MPKQIQECIPRRSSAFKFLYYFCPDFWRTVIAQTFQVRNGDIVEILTVGAFASVFGSERRLELAEEAGINTEKQECLQIRQRLDLRVVRGCVGHCLVHQVNEVVLVRIMDSDLHLNTLISQFFLELC